MNNQLTAYWWAQGKMSDLTDQTSASNGTNGMSSGAGVADGTPRLSLTESASSIQTGYSPSSSGENNNNNSSSNNNKDSERSIGKRRKKKVDIACVYCRRSHMICDDSRPCQRCIKRGIGHLCYDEPSNPRQRKKVAQLKKQPDTPNNTTTTITNNTTSSTTTTGLTPLTVQLSLLPLGLQTPSVQTQSQAALGLGGSSTLGGNQNQQMMTNNMGGPRASSSVLSQTMQYNQEPFFYSEHAGSEFSSLNDFLSMIDDPELVNGALGDNAALLNFEAARPNDMNGSQGKPLHNSISNTSLANILSFSPNPNNFSSTFGGENVTFQQNTNQDNLSNNSTNANGPSNNNSFQNGPAINTNGNNTNGMPGTNNNTNNFNNNINTNTNNDNNSNKNPSTQNEKDETHQPVISDSARDKFFLTAADPTTEISPEERLKQVIKAKLEAGLLQPYNYAKGYARLQTYMDNYMNASSRQRILKPLSEFRPAFRAIARTLKDVDLVLVEESFERMLLDYDRVFTSMAIPACLWRRTGEIYRGNKEFASLVGVMTDDLKDGKLAIYELMSEESAVNFWEKYGAIAFDKGQKAVLTSCNLRTKDGIKRKSCCFSFTIRRDRYNIPSCIVGNFIPIDP